MHSPVLRTSHDLNHLVAQASLRNNVSCSEWIFVFRETFRSLSWSSLSSFFGSASLGLDRIHGNADFSAAFRRHLFTVSGFSVLCFCVCGVLLPTDRCLCKHCACDEPLRNIHWHTIRRKQMVRLVFWKYVMGDGFSSVTVFFAFVKGQTLPYQCCTLTHLYHNSLHYVWLHWRTFWS